MTKLVEIHLASSFLCVLLLICSGTNRAVAQSPCEMAYDACDFTFEGATGPPVPSYGGINSNPDSTFTPQIMAKDGTYLASLNTNCAAEIVNGTDIYPITDQGFSQNQFRAYKLRNGKGSAIGHETFQPHHPADDLVDACVRVTFTSWQVLDGDDGNVVSNVNTNTCNSTACVVFKLGTR